MSAFNIKRVFKYFFALLGALLVLNGTVLLFTSNFNLGIVLTLALGVGILTLLLLPRKMLSKIPKWIKTTFVILICLFIAFAAFVFVYGSKDTADYGEDAVIVLGAGIKGTKLSVALENRLKAAIEYHKNNPDALIVVSGGQGAEEDITEAAAMEAYLLNNGVAKDKIIKEEKAVSTATNFEYSKAILDERLGKDYKVAFISNEYHILRAEISAAEQGFENMTHLHSNTLFYSVVPAALREVLAIAAYVVF